MAFVVQNQVQALTSDGTAAGVVTVTDSKKFWPGAVAVLAATGQPDMEVVILSDAGTNQLRLRDRASKHYGPADLSAYTVAAGAALRMSEQMIFNTPIEGVVPRVPSFLATPA